MSIKERLIQEYLDSKNPVKTMDDVSDSINAVYMYDNDPILNHLRLSSSELLSKGFEDAAIKQLQDYLSLYYPDKLNIELEALLIKKP